MLSSFRGDYTDEYRVGFRHNVNSAEDAKSEVMKLFQEVKLFRMMATIIVTAIMILSQERK